MKKEYNSIASVNKNYYGIIYYSISLLFLFIIHIFTYLNPTLIKHINEILCLLPFYWLIVLSPKNILYDNRPFMKRWNDDIVMIPIIGKLVLFIVVTYGLIILLLSSQARNELFQYYGLLIYEIFWIFIYLLGLILTILHNDRYRKGS